MSFRSRRLTNEGGAPIEVADLGVSMPFNQFFADKAFSFFAWWCLRAVSSASSQWDLL